jgi:hypothetical protein
MAPELNLTEQEFMSGQQSEEPVVRGGSPSTTSLSGLAATSA